MQDDILGIVAGVIPCSSMVERVPVKDEVVGSNPTGGASCDLNIPK